MPAVESTRRSGKPPRNRGDPLPILPGIRPPGLRGPIPEGPSSVKLRVVADQPWDVPADVLVVPIFGNPPFADAVGELDRRTGGELAALITFGELSPKRFGAVLAGAGATGPKRLLGIRCGKPDELDREAVVHVGASAERRLRGRPVRSPAASPPPPSEPLGGRAPAALPRSTRGAVHGS